MGSGHAASLALAPEDDMEAEFARDVALLQLPCCELKAAEVPLPARTLEDFRGLLGTLLSVSVPGGAEGGPPASKASSPARHRAESGSSSPACGSHSARR